MRTLKFRSTALASALALTGLLSACGGGGGGGGGASSPVAAASSTTSTTPATTIPAGTTQSTPTYAAGSVQLAMFNQINAYRQTCGFPAVQQNTLLDQAAQNHAQYMIQNGGQLTDAEVQGNPGFTGATYMDRAAHVGMPSSVYVAGGASGWYNNNSLLPTAMGQALATVWTSAVYHQALIVWPYNYLGFGVGQTQSNGYTLDIASENIAFDPSNTNDIDASGAPLTFPCQGMTGVPYGINGEIPMPPNTSSSGFGTPVTVIGRMSDQVTLTTANMVNTMTGQTISLNILNTNTDPNKLIPSFQASAYPTSLLSANTTYQVNLTGTINGKAFSRSFTFTTSSTLA
jgi:uncharacterized protein YkwD